MSGSMHMVTEVETFDCGFEVEAWCDAYENLLSLILLLECW